MGGWETFGFGCLGVLLLNCPRDQADPAGSAMDPAPGFAATLHESAPLCGACRYGALNAHSSPGNPPPAMATTRYCSPSTL